MLKVRPSSQQSQDHTAAGPSCLPELSLKSTWDSTHPSPASCSRVLNRLWQVLGTGRWGIQYHFGLPQDIQSAKTSCQMCFCTMCSTGTMSVPAHASPNVACPPCRDNLPLLVSGALEGCVDSAKLTYLCILLNNAPWLF